MERAPFALREAGLLERLRAQGLRVVNLSDLSLFPFREDTEHPRQRNVEVAACAARAAADEMTRAIPEGFTLILGGDCSLTPGTVGGARKALGQPVGLVYLDADADLNTPETTPSGCLNGMALALALGRGPLELAASGGELPAVIGDHVAMVGYRALDPGERPALGALGLALPAVAARKLGMHAASALAFEAVNNGDGPILVHLDVDVIDPAEMPAKDTLTPGQGLTLQELSDLLTALLASPRVIALQLTEFNPERDPDGAMAARLVDLLTRAVARHFRS
jgi:arginase